MSCHLTFCNLCFFVRVLPQSCCFSAYKPLQGCICHTLLRWVLLLPTPLPKAEISMLLSHSLSVPHQSIICHQSYGFSLIFLCILYIHPVFSALGWASFLCCLDYCTGLLMLLCYACSLFIDLFYIPPTGLSFSNAVTIMSLSCM